MKRILKFILLLGIMTVSCTTDNKEKKDSANVDIKTLPMNGNKNLSVIDKSISLIKYICLDDNDEGRFTKIDKIKIIDDLIYIMDKSGQHAVFVFDLDGNYIRKIGTKGRGPGEYNMLCDFDVANDGKVYLYNSQHKKMHIYDALGNFIGEERTSFRADGFNLLDNNRYIFSLLKENDDNSLNDNPKVIITNSSFSIERIFFSYNDEFVDGKSNNNVFRETLSGIIYHKPVNDSIYRFDKTGNLKKGYFLDFGKNSLPQKFKDDYLGYMMSNKDRIYTYMYDSPLILSNLVMGNIYLNDNNKGLFVYDINNNISYIKKFSRDNFSHKNLSFPLFILNDETIVSYIDYQIYSAFVDKESIEDKVKRHIENGGIVLSLFDIKI